MKKFYLVVTIIGLTLLLAACGQGNDMTNSDKNNDIVTNEQGQNNTTEPSNNDENVVDQNTTNNSDATNEPNTDDQVQKMESLDYSDFELDVKYGNDQDYEVDLELDHGRVEAKLEDDLTGVEIEGDGAFDEIYPLVEQLTIEQNTAKEDAITQVIDIFDLPSDYQNFELEIRFKDGTKIEFEDRK